MLVRGSAAAAHHVEPAVVEEALEDAPEILRRFHVDALLVRQSRVGHAADPGASQVRQGSQRVGHELRARGAVEAQVQQIGVQEGDRQGLGVLPRQHGAGGLDGHRHRHGQAPSGLTKGLFDSQQACLDVPGVLTGLEQQVVGTAGHEPQSLDAIVLDELLEGHTTGHRDGLGRGPHGAADEAWPGRHRKGPTGFPSQLRRQSIEIVGPLGQVVLGQHQGCPPETVGLHDVGPGFEIEPVETQHYVRSRDAQVLVAALEVGAAEVFSRQVLALEARSRGTVHDQDALLQGLQQSLGTCLPILRARRDRYVEMKVTHRWLTPSTLAKKTTRFANTTKAGSSVGHLVASCQAMAGWPHPRSPTSPQGSEMAPWLSVPGCRVRISPDRSGCWRQG